MNLRLCTGLAAIVCMTLASCYPYNEKSRSRPSGQQPTKTVTAPDATKKKQDEQKKTAAQDELKPREEATTQTPPENPGTVTPTEGPKPQGEKRSDYQFANKVPGKEGFVFSPYNNKVIDVRDIPSGTLVQDPTFPASEKKYFRVP